MNHSENRIQKAVDELILSLREFDTSYGNSYEFARGQITQLVALFTVAGAHDTELMEEAMSIVTGLSKH